MDEWKARLKAGGAEFAAAAAEAAAPPASRAPRARPEESIPEIETYDLAGVPVYFLPAVGRTTVCLSFGVGRAYEPVTQGGLTHLAEHLIAGAAWNPAEHMNGVTMPFRVAFVTTGAPDAASRYVREICAAVGRPRLGRMHEEADVLRTEADPRGRLGIGLAPFSYRTGYQGIGTVALPELFLHQLDEGVLRRWIEAHFVAGNAAIWVNGQLPADLAAELPPGPRTTPPEQASVPGLETPTRVIGPFPGVAATFLLDRTPASESALHTLQRRLLKSMRIDRGLSYDVHVSGIAVGPERQLASAWVSCLPKSMRDAERLLLEAIDDVAGRGPTDDELEHEYREMVLAGTDPTTGPERLDAHVTDVLLGGPTAPVPPGERLQAQWTLRSDDVAAAFRRARDTMIVVAPDSGYTPLRAFHRYPAPATDPAGRGRTFDLIGKPKGPIWARARRPKLSIGDGGVSIDLWLDASGEHRLVAIAWRECVAVLQDRGSRILLGRDGRRIEVVAADWRGAPDVLRLIDRLAPRDLVVRLSPPEAPALLR